MSRTRVRLLPFLLVLLAFAPRPAAAGIDHWTPLGPDGGTVTALAADPQIHGTLYAGTAGGAVWKSLDGGAHWFSASAGLSSFDTTALAVAPGGSGRVWAGTPGGIYQTDDGGASWRRVWSVPGRPDGALDHWILSLAADPTDPEVAWAGTWSGVVLRTTDGGASWVEIPLQSGAVNDIAVDPLNPEVVYVANHGIFKSTDGGITWPRIRDQGALTLLLDPVDPRIIYTADGLDLISKSTDAGATWTQLTRIEGNIDGLFLDPTDPSVLLAGTSLGALMRSEDAGATWQRVEGLPLLSSFTFAADSSGRLWLGVNNRGVFRSLDGGTTWRVTNRGLAGSHIVDVESDPFRPQTLYAVAQGTALHRSVNGGATWRRSNTGLPEVGTYGFLLDDLAPSPHVPGLLIAGNEAGIYRSRDRGAHWSAAWHPGAVRSIAFSSRPDEVFAGGDSLLRSRDGGRTWKVLPRPDTSYDSEIARVLVSPLRPRLVYFLDINERRGDAKSLFRSLDSGESSRLVFEGGPTALAFHPTRRGTQILATYYGGEIWKTVDQGTTWERIAEGIGNGIQLTALLYDRVDPSILYLGTDGAGVLRSLDGGVTWAPLATGMIAPRITSLRSDPRNPRRLLAGTQGGGVLEIRLTTP